MQFLFVVDSSLLISTVFHYAGEERQWKNNLQFEGMPQNTGNVASIQNNHTV